jgi:hypothetical protein
VHGGFGHRPYWGGGYWHGVFWPHAYYRTGFAWFLPVLPLGCVAYYWGGVPYYYWDNLYYTWDSGYNGYAVTTPPPAEGSADVAATTDDSQSGGGSADVAATTDDSQSGGSADVYIYPRNGQTDEQTADDRYECHKWAVGQTGFDPTRSSSSSGSASEYRRAMTACLDARGYSAK